MCIPLSLLCKLFPHVSHVGKPTRIGKPMVNKCYDTFWHYVPLVPVKALCSVVSCQKHSMLHGGVALFKTFCNVPSSNLNFFGERPLHDHATTFVLFCSFVMHGLQKQYWHSSCEVSGGITNSGLSSSSVSFATLSLFACIL